MELRQIKAFVTLADTLNFTRASEMLFITQSTLSKQIFSLEEDLNVKLFSRDTHSVMLTDNGLSFLVEARRVLSQVEKAVSAARCNVERRYDASLIVGYDRRLDSTSSLTGAYLKLYTCFNREHPQVDVQIKNLEYAGLIKALQDKTIDLAVMLHEGRIMQAVLDTMINSIPISNDEFVFLIPREDKVAGTSFDLKKLLMNYKNAYISRHHAAFSTAGEIFKSIDIYPYVQFCDSWAEILMKVSRGEGFTFCPYEQYRELDMQNVVAVSYEGGDFLASVMIHWDKNNTNPYVQEFLKNVNETANDKAVISLLAARG